MFHSFFGIRALLSFTKRWTDHLILEFGEIYPSIGWSNYNGNTHQPQSNRRDVPAGSLISINISNLSLKNRGFTHAMSSQPTRRGVERSHRQHIFRLAPLKMVRHRGLSTSLEAARCGKCLVLEKHSSCVDAYETSRQGVYTVVGNFLVLYLEAITDATPCKTSWTIAGADPVTSREKSPPHTHSENESVIFGVRRWLLVFIGRITR